MKQLLLLIAAMAFLHTSPGGAQTPPPNGRAPIFHVTVIERTVKAVNYQYRSGPTQIDFRGTVLLPLAKGDATVESKAGRTEIDAKMDRLESPQKFGTGYLTYVLWAISPEGHAKNLGELIPGSSDHAKIHVTTDLQAFGLIVTAEPYSAVREPSDVVVMENQLRPDTIGKSEPIEAKYELLPRGHYTYTMPDQGQPEPGGPKVSMERYEATLEVYQAQNAVQIAQSLGADKYAPEVYSKASDLLRQAQDLNFRKADRATIVMSAREAAQTAEDARLITLQRQHDAELAQSRDQTQRERDLRAQAEAREQAAQTQIADQQRRLDEERIAREHAEAQVAAMRSQPAVAPAPPPPATVVVVQKPGPDPRDSQRAALRVSLMQQLNAGLPVRDTPRGILVTVPDTDFQGRSVRGSVDAALSHIAPLVAAHPGLVVEVEGNCDPATDDRMAYERAVAVREALVRSGIPADWIVARGMGATRPLVANTSPAGREQNRRVEIVISGEPIGSMAHWDHSYSLMNR
jgi:flagellar motor protein MotB